MDILYLKEFAVLAEVGNYLKAADALFISQSSLSKHIQALEKELDVPLFDRSTRRVRLTAFGQTFLPFARKIVNLHYQAEVALMNQKSDKLQKLSLGSIPSLTPYGITDQIVRFQAENRSVAVQLYEDESERLLQGLRRNQYDLVFIRDRNEPSEEFAKIPFAEDRLCAVLPKGHPLAKRARLSLQELQAENFLFLSPDTLLYQLCIDACNACGFAPRVVYSGRRSETILDLVAKGMGVALLMRRPIDCARRDDIAAVDIEPAVTTSIQIYYKKDAVLSLAAKHFVAALQFTD